MAWKLFVFPIFLICLSGIESGRIVFPDDKTAGNQHEDTVSVNVVTSSLVSRFGSESDVLIPKRCQELGFCEDPVSYPDALAAKLSHQIEAASMFLDSDDNITSQFSISVRFGSIYENPCKATHKNVAPRLADDGDGNWYFILNTKERPIQTYNVELCEQERNAPSSDRQECSVILMYDYESACVQKYVYREMIAIVDNKPVRKSFKIPCCCTCVAKYLVK